MTRSRTSAFQLEAAVRVPGFTPRVADTAALVALAAAGDEQLAPVAMLALTRLGPDAADELESVLAAAHAKGDEAMRVAVAQLEGRLRGPAAVDVLVERLEDKSPRVRKAAAQALGRLGPEAARAEPPLLARWKTLTKAALDARTLPEARAVAESLGKVGGKPSGEALEKHKAAPDHELKRIIGRALLRIGRERPPEGAPAAPGEAGGAAAPAPAPDRIAATDTTIRARIVLGTRNGIEPILMHELTALGFEPKASAGGVEIFLDGPLSRLFAARTWSGLWFPLGRVPNDPAAVVKAFARGPALKLLGALGPPPWRYRLAWADGRHRRAATLAHVVALGEAEKRLANDPAGAPWELQLTLVGQNVDLELHAKGLVDPRWAWRSGDVPAASHPPLAAALAHVAEAGPTDVVWDPFCGSGLELAERHLLGPCARLVGTDTDARAIEVARVNLAAAGVPADRLTLEVADAATYAVPGVSLIITNPPMGRRVQRGDVGPLLDGVVERAAKELVKGGRLVWLSPVPDRTLAAAGRAGFRVSVRQRVDMGGFTAELQRFDR